MTQLRWGILSTGHIAHVFTQDLVDAGFDVAAVASRSPDAAIAFASEFGIARAHGSYADLAADPDVDIVYIATPHALHAENALQMIAAGKHVLVEKAFTVDAVQAERVRVAARAAGVLAMEAMWTRYLPHMARIREIIAEGTLGEIRAVTADHAQYLPRADDHRLNDPALGGGALLDLGIYPVSFVWDILGEPQTISAAATLTPTGVDGSVATTFTYPSGAIAQTFSSMLAAGPIAATIIGAQARIEIAPWWFAQTSFRVVGADGAVLEEFVTQPDGRGMHHQARAAEQLIAAGRIDSEILPLSESVAILRALDEIRRQIGVDYPSDLAD